MASSYIPPLRHHFLMRFYDPLVRLTTRERAFRRLLLEQLQAERGWEVLDLGCGTGTLAIELIRARPGVKVTAIDADPDALSIARRKASRQSEGVTFIRGFAQHLPFESGRFDTVVSSLFFHHLTRADKKSALTEAWRVLKPKGGLHVADWGRPQNALMRLCFLPVRLLDGLETTAECIDDGLLALMHAAGFTEAAKTAHINTPLGSMGIYRAAKPDERGLSPTVAAI